MTIHTRELPPLLMLDNANTQPPSLPRKEEPARGQRGRAVSISRHTRRDLVLQEPASRLNLCLREIASELSKQCDVEVPGGPRPFNCLHDEDGPWASARLIDLVSSVCQHPDHRAALLHQLRRAVASHFPFIEPEHLESSITIRDMAYAIFHRIGA